MTRQWIVAKNMAERREQKIIQQSSNLQVIAIHIALNT